MALPTIAPPGNAPYTYVVLADNNGLYLPSLPIGAPGGITAGGDGKVANTVPETSVGIFNGVTIDRWASPFSMGVANATNGFPGVAQYAYNNASFDAVRNNIDVGAVINAVAATTTQTSSTLFNLNGRGAKVVLNMSNAGTGSVTLHIQGFDSGGSAFYDQLVGAAITTNSVNVYTVYPGLPATANVSANDIIPRSWRIQVVVNNANATTYTVSVVMML
jgi:hypothetical protein